LDVFIAIVGTSYSHFRAMHLAFHFGTKVVSKAFTTFQVLGNLMGEESIAACRKLALLECIYSIPLKPYIKEN